MKNKIIRVVILALGLMTTVAMPLVAKGQPDAVAGNPTKVATLRSIFPGTEPAAMEEILAAVNEKMAKDIGVELELVWAPWDQYSNKFDMAIAAGEKVDFRWEGSSDMARLTAQKMIVPIDEQLEKYGDLLYATVDKSLFDTMKIDGKVMGFPSTGNSPKAHVHQAITYREDLRVKYDVPPLNSIENLEKFFEAIKKNEPEMTPLMAQSCQYRIMRAFGSGEFLGGTNGAAGFRVIDNETVEVMPIQELPAYIGSVRKAREWFLRGYQHPDILNVGRDASPRMHIGAVAAIGGSAMSAAENQGTISQNVPEARLADAVVVKAGATSYLKGNGGNALYVTSVTDLADEVVQFWGWVIANQGNYDLYCYGIEGKHYEIVNGRLRYLSTDYSDFPHWMFKNMAYFRFPEGSSDEYIQTIKDWDKGKVPSPIANFVFNPKNVESELAQFSAVWGEYSAALGAGTLDLDENLPEIVERFKAAGQDKIVAEAQRQINESLAAN